MKSLQRYLTLLLALSTIGAGWLAWRQSREIVALRTAAMNTNERAHWQKRLWDSEKLNRELGDQLAASRAGEVSPTADDPSAARGVRGGREGRGATPNRNQALLSAFMAKPELQRVMAQQNRFNLERQYAALFRNLRLSPEQADKVMKILADRDATMQDVRSLAREQGLDPRNHPEAYQKLVAIAQADIDASIQRAIGEAGFTEFQTYEQTLPQRGLVNDLQQRLSYTDHPLNQSQAEQLVQILASNAAPAGASANSTPLGGRIGFGGGPIGLGGASEVEAIASVVLNLGVDGAPITPAALTQAQSVLSPPQFAALQGVQQHQQAQQQLQQLVRTGLQRNPPASPNNGRGGATGGNPARGGG
ncbi:MAG: hypothetical protein ABIZ49_00385 [Opitutaceae bacterium]